MFKEGTYVCKKPSTVNNTIEVIKVEHANYYFTTNISLKQPFELLVVY